MRCLKHCLVLAGLLAALLPREALALDNSDCYTCHEDKALTKKGAGGKAISLCVDQAKYGASMHASNACTSCHADITEAPHPEQRMTRASISSLSGWRGAPAWAVVEATATAAI